MNGKVTPTPRTTRLIRTPHLQGFRDALVALAIEGEPLDARDRLIVLPTRTAATHLVRTLEDRLLTIDGALVLPELVTPGELVGRLGERLSEGRPVLRPAEREVLAGVACRAARDAGFEPPFKLRPGLVAEVLRFYDSLQRHQKDIDTFERLALGMLEPGASYDRGAERLVRQTRFLVAAFRELERRCQEHGVDEHGLRDRVIHEAATRPWRHLVLTVTDRACDPHGLFPADWDLLARVPGLERLDVLVTDTTLAGALHEHIHNRLPGIEEVHAGPADPAHGPLLVIPPGGSLVHVARDREEEVAAFARRIKHANRCGQVAPDRVALVVHQPLPYMYVAREVLRSAGVPCQMFDALPLAAEPYAATLDIVCSAVSAGFARGPSIALLRSPYFAFVDGPPKGGPHVQVAALDRALNEAGYLGEIDALERLLESWREAPSPRRQMILALQAGETLLAIDRELTPLRSSLPVADHLETLLTFLTAHERLPDGDDPHRDRQLRARSAVLGTLTALAEAYRKFDDRPVEFDEVGALMRRWIEVQTFAPRAGDSGVHLVDAASARFGDFDHVQLAGLVDGEWPDRPRRNIFYSPALLKELGWPGESERLAAARASFADLLRLPSSRVVVSTFTLEADAIVTPSPLLDELEAIAPDAIEERPAPHRIFDYEALAMDPVALESLTDTARAWALRRLGIARDDERRFHGTTEPHREPAYSLSALERYQDCPFKYFAANVLHLDEDADDGSTVSPRARGRLIHELFQRFFEAWDRQRGGTITSACMDEARALCRDIAEPLLARLPQADAALERARLFGSAIAMGTVDVVLGLEASRPADVRERWLEYRLEGHFALGSASGPRVSLKGVADRIDLLAGHRLRVIDYKSGQAPNVRRALQVPVYALCAQERLGERDGHSWVVEDAAYISFGGKRPLTAVVKPGGADADGVLDEARDRLLTAVSGIEHGDFPPRPYDPMICRYCSYSTVCRKDYVEDA